MTTTRWHAWAATSSRSFWRGLRRPGDAGRIAAQLAGAIERPFRYANQEVQARGSIGIALFPVDADNACDLLKQADIALYRTKRSEPRRLAVLRRVDAHPP